MKIRVNILVQFRIKVPEHKKIPEHTLQVSLQKQRNPCIKRPEQIQVKQTYLGISTEVKKHMSDMRR